MTYNTTTGRIFNSVEKAFDQAEKTLDDVFSGNFWSLLDHPEFPFISLESTTNGQRNFPPYNIVELRNGQTRLEVAVAGYSKERLKVELEGNTLIIRSVPSVSNINVIDDMLGEGEQTEDHAFVVPGKCRKQGISNGVFLRTFTMQPNTIVNGVRLQDGILSVVLSTKQPQSSKTAFEIK